MVSLGGFLVPVQQSQKNIVDGMEKVFHIVEVIQTTIKQMTYAEYTAASPEVRAAFDAAREAKKVAYRLANTDQEAEARAELAAKLTANRDAVFLATGNRDVYDLPVPSSSNLGWAHDEAVMQDYKRRKAIVAALLASQK